MHGQFHDNDACKLGLSLPAFTCRFFLFFPRPLGNVVPKFPFEVAGLLTVVTSCCRADSLSSVFRGLLLPMVVEEKGLLRGVV